jgi:hypothetical protein
MYLGFVPLVTLLGWELSPMLCAAHGLSCATKAILILTGRDRSSGGELTKAGGSISVCIIALGVMMLVMMAVRAFR